MVKNKVFYKIGVEQNTWENASWSKSNLFTVQVQFREFWIHCMLLSVVGNRCSQGRAYFWTISFVLQENHVWTTETGKLFINSLHTVQLLHHNSESWFFFLLLIFFFPHSCNRKRVQCCTWGVDNSHYQQLA